MLLLYNLDAFAPRNLHLYGTWDIWDVSAFVWEPVESFCTNRYLSPALNENQKMLLPQYRNEIQNHLIFADLVKQDPGRARQNS